MPRMQEDLTAETTKKVLDAFAKGEKPKPGPQSGRHTSENSAGLTALTEKVRLRPGPACTSFANLTRGQPYGPGQHCQPEFA